MARGSSLTAFLLILKSANDPWHENQPVSNQVLASWLLVRGHPACPPSLWGSCRDSVENLINAAASRMTSHTFKKLKSNISFEPLTSVMFFDSLVVPASSYFSYLRPCVCAAGSRWNHVHEVLLPAAWLTSEVLDHREHAVLWCFCCQYYCDFLASDS